MSLVCNESFDLFIHKPAKTDSRRSQIKKKSLYNVLCAPNGVVIAFVEYELRRKEMFLFISEGGHFAWYCHLLSTENDIAVPKG